VVVACNSDILSNVTCFLFWHVCVAVCAWVIGSVGGAVQNAHRQTYSLSITSVIPFSLYPVFFLPFHRKMHI
jgi:hypothetical protein